MIFIGWLWEILVGCVWITIGIGVVSLLNYSPKTFEAGFITIFWPVTLVIVLFEKIGRFAIYVRQKIRR